MVTDALQKVILYAFCNWHEMPRYLCICMETVLMYEISHFLISLNFNDFKYYIHSQHKSSKENTI